MTVHRCPRATTSLVSVEAEYTKTAETNNWRQRILSQSMESTPNHTLCEVHTRPVSALTGHKPA